MNQLAHADSDYPLSDEVFAAFQRLTLEQTGIELADTKRAMISTRFSRRLRTLGLQGFDEYLALVQTANHSERVDFIDTVTTNLTYFFRELSHFDNLKHSVFPELNAIQNTQDKPIRIWSAGCSSGQEPYSIAMMALEAESQTKRPVRILCTDIHTKLIAQTEQGIYSQSELRGLDEKQLKKWFEPVDDQRLQVMAALRSMLLCRHMNLFAPWPIRPNVDIIFCRNTLIYFDIEHQTRVVRGFASLQSPGARLFLGHSETIKQCADIYKRVSNTTYERI
ncbi:MAG: protein-glutamate O-methyltransferase CheR [Granulosicoccaceae bacterium]